MKSFAGKTVVITGAASGIGRALALQSARAGAKIAICDLDSKGLAETARLSALTDQSVLSMTVDVSDAGAVEQFASEVAKKFGAADVLINNAGVSLSQLAVDMSKSQLEWVFSINFWGVIHGCSAFLPQLRSRSEAHIVNISSLFGIIPMANHAAYVASKFAVRGYTETLRLELKGANIGVSCVHPGGVDTGIARNGLHFAGKSGQIDAEVVATKFKILARCTPDAAAAQILRGIKRNKALILVGHDAKFVNFANRLAPGVVRFILGLIAKGVEERQQGLALKSPAPKVQSGPLIVFNDALEDSP